MPIPRIIHQTAPTSELPAWGIELRRRTVELHPHWEHRFYDDRDCRELIRRQMPYLLPVYDGYREGIQRADMFRVVAVYVTGGFYLDVDVECREPLDPLCRHGCVLGEENVLTAEEAAVLGHRDRQRVANYLFGAEAGHPFLLDVVEEMLRRAERPLASDHDVLESTGPGLVTEVYHRVAARYADLALVRNPGISCRKCLAACCQFGKFAAHLHVGSWRGRRATPAMAQDNGGAGTGRRRRHDSDSPIVLATYTEPECDGLTTAFARVREVGTLAEDTTDLAGRRVLVPGIPFLYERRLSPRNFNVVMTGFESSRLPPYWVDSINRSYHACVVGHESVAGVFSDSGVRVPLHVVPLGFTRYPRHRLTAPPADSFRVGFLGIPVPRKNLDKLVTACARLVGTIPNLRLAVHVSHWYPWLDPSAWDGARAAPFVEWSEGVRSKQELAAWFGRLSCYVYPSSGEGWSFTPRESLFLGVPTVVSVIPAHDELVRSGFCRVIPLAGREPADFGGIVSGEWGRVEVDDIVRALTEVHANRVAARAQATAGARWVGAKWFDADTRFQLRELLARL